MKYRKLGNTNTDVSVICLGTMTWGEQNTLQEAHEQLDYSFDNGVNFIDTAEMYPVPPNPNTYSTTEQIIGKWSKLKTDRDKIVLATKIVGPMSNHYVRAGVKEYSYSNIKNALESSLKRLDTDYIDLYQLHWPERKTNYFGQRGFNFEQIDNDYSSFESILETLTTFQKEGKIKHIGLSNETPWGLMKYLQVSKENNLSRVVSVQNPYSLLNRTYEVGMAEISQRENVGLLAYSPLAFGVLSGKYLNGKKPAGARLTIWDYFTRYLKPNAQEATQKYFDIANDYGISLTQLALAFVNTRPFVTSNIIGATNMEQLKENISSINVNITESMLHDLENVQMQYPDPCP